MPLQVCPVFSDVLSIHALGSQFLDLTLQISSFKILSESNLVYFIASELVFTSDSYMLLYLSIMFVSSFLTTQDLNWTWSRSDLFFLPHNSVCTFLESISAHLLSKMVLNAQMKENSHNTADFLPLPYFCEECELDTLENCNCVSKENVMTI